MPAIISGTTRRWMICFLSIGFLLLAGDKTRAARRHAANVTIEGYVGQAPAGTPTEARIVLQFGSLSFDFDLIRTTEQTGDGSKNQLLEDIRPRQNTLVLRGSNANRNALKAGAGQRFLISGYHRSGSQVLEVTKLSPAAPDPTPSTVHP